MAGHRDWHHARRHADVRRRRRPPPGALDWHDTARVRGTAARLRDDRCDGARFRRFGHARFARAGKPRRNGAQRAVGLQRGALRDRRAVRLQHGAAGHDRNDSAAARRTDAAPMIALPPMLAPPAPFPLVLSQWSTREEIAPGMARTDYRLTTNAGPLVVHVVELDPHDPTVRLEAVVARDRMISKGETVSSMAARTGAVAGINADYFDIGNTNQPLNVAGINADYFDIGNTNQPLNVVV